MKNLKSLIFYVAVPLLIGGLAALLTGGGMSLYPRLNQPPFAPPGWVFPIAWTVLYTLMGIAAYLVSVSAAPQSEKKSALTLYWWQLIVNFLWPIFFFGFGWYLFAFVWLLFLWVLVFFTLISFYQISKPAGILLLPYLLWLTFAAYLNWFVYILN